MPIGNVSLQMIFRKYFSLRCLKHVTSTFVDEPLIPKEFVLVLIQNNHRYHFSGQQNARRENTSMTTKHLQWADWFPWFQQAGVSTVLLQGTSLHAVQHPHFRNNTLH